MFNNLIFFLLLFFNISYLSAFEFSNPTEVALSSISINQAFKTALSYFIDEKNFPEVILSVSQNGETIIDQCYGKCKDSSAIYPIASVSKLFTEAAIKQLIYQKKISSDTKVISYLHLNYAVLDARVNEITIQQLLDHTGGWDRELSNDPLFSFDMLPATIDSKDKLMRYVLTTQQLDHAPGEVESYSNFGYFLLGQVIEKASGMKYLDFINKNFAEPNQIYLYQAKIQKSKEVDSPLNYFNLDVATASFGLAANISDLTHYFSKVTREGFEKHADADANESWWKDGSLPGSVTSIVIQRANNVVLAAYIPTRDEDHWMEDNELLNEIISQTAKSVGL